MEERKAIKRRQMIWGMIETFPWLINFNIVTHSRCEIRPRGAETEWVRCVLVPRIHESHHVRQVAQKTNGGFCFEWAPHLFADHLSITRLCLLSGEFNSAVNGQWPLTGSAMGSEYVRVSFNYVIH